MNIANKILLSSKDVKPAPIWRRVAAIFYDLFLVIALLISVGFIQQFFTVIINKFNLTFLEKINQKAFFVVLLLVTITFFCYFWIKAKQTLGMRAWKIYICNADYSSISFKQAIIRCLVAIPAISLCFIGILWPLIDKKKRSWQDIASATITCHSLDSPS